jgi:ribonuclease BN (tRNA processing enzyme)
MVIDCGATSLVAMKRAGVDPSEIGTIAISHLHGDHFGGLPFLILDGQFSRRELPLTIVGPPGIEARTLVAMEALFPGSSTVQRRFPVQFVELQEREARTVGACLISPRVAEHASGAPSYSLRIEYGGRSIAYSGDTEWIEALEDLVRGADVFICEAYYFDKKVKFHLDYATLLEHRGELECARIVLTHMSADMLGRADLAFEQAYDGLIIEI